ncbi:hypothetical protein [Consotaella salsifontis]|uniref:Phage shock protein B n=1 Tax=Consotaella salsifontis TaxID=1365950 RepID=A0A1T4T557_9HYPH|nr:hypothetical protein [Consotaella salsifontis]SKA35582.1 hypothetical protein SAMN05428963_11967 [Consotaella salsifontis]
MGDFVGIWLPIILLIAVMVWLMQRSRRTMARHVAETEAINERILEANRDIVTELREIKLILRDRA